MDFLFMTSAKVSLFVRPASKAQNGSPSITSAEVSFEFLFNNCVEATKLWTRIQYQSPIRDRAKRENDRHSLRVLVGANLVCMGQLDSATVEFYKTVEFPKLISQITSSKDIMAQQYLLECIVQGTTSMKITPINVGWSDAGPYRAQYSVSFLWSLPYLTSSLILQYFIPRTSNGIVHFLAACGTFMTRLDDLV